MGRTESQCVTRVMGGDGNGINSLFSSSLLSFANQLSASLSFLSVGSLLRSDCCVVLAEANRTHDNSIIEKKRNIETGASQQHNLVIHVSQKGETAVCV